MYADSSALQAFWFTWQSCIYSLGDIVRATSFLLLLQRTVIIIILSLSLGSKPSRWRSNDTDHPSVLTPGHVMELSKIVFLATVSHCSRKLIRSSNGTLMNTFCPFLQDRNLLSFNKWLSIIAVVSGKLKLQTFVSPFQSGPILDYWWHWHFMD